MRSSGRIAGPSLEDPIMATTINTYLKGVKLITASTLSALETAVNTYITGLDGLRRNGVAIMVNKRV